MSKYKRLVLLMLGVVFLIFCHSLINNFFLQILLPIGGDSSALGTAVFLAAIVELPAMWRFNDLVKKVSVDRLLKISSIFFLLKHILTYFATNMTMIYIAQILQVGAYAIAYPALVEYVNAAVDNKDLVKGQSLLTVAMGISGVFASWAGGHLMDQIGVGNTLLVGVIATAIGVAIVFLSAENVHDQRDKAIADA